jgi:hypothetical protein
VRDAEDVLRQGHILLDLPKALLVKARLHQLTNSCTDGLHCATEALTIAAPRQLQLLQADSLVTRSTLRLKLALSGGNLNNLYKALDDGESALTMARSSGNKWTELTANSVLRDIWSSLGDRQKSSNYEGAAAALRILLEPSSAL